VAAGAGVGHTKYKVLGASDSSTGFLWQVMAGFDVPMNDRFTWDVRYRYVHSPEIDYSAQVGLTTYTVEVETTAHVLSVGGRLSF
jgi:opacity protein-like surface antigen